MESNSPARSASVKYGAEPVVIGVGRLVPQKDWPTLIRAFYQARHEVGFGKLIILGSGSLQNKLNKLIRSLSLDDHVDLAGTVQNPYSYVGAAHIFASSSKLEGLSNAVIEALALGKPIVATACPTGTKEILKDGQYGDLVPVGAVNAMGDVLIRLLREQKTAPFCHFRPDAYRAFTEDEVLGQYAELIDRNLEQTVYQDGSLSKL